MKLNLAEIAYCLGCTPDKIIQKSSDTVTPVVIPSPEELSASQASAQALVDKNLEAKGSDTLFSRQERAGWMSVIPTGAQYDSQAVLPGNLFFCLPGERADGHDFALNAARAGASAIIATHNPFAGKVEKYSSSAQFVLPPVFLVEDSKKALWEVAMLHRDTTRALVVGVTGTAGKTTIKEVLAQVLGLQGRTAHNPRNLNNQIGLPTSMLNAPADAAFWVMEIGISEAQDMDELGQILRPDVALILNVGEAHLTGLNKLGVAGNKARLLKYIRPGGTALASLDYPDLNREVEARATSLTGRGIRLARFSTCGSDAGYRAFYAGATSNLSGRYRVFIRGREYLAEAPFCGDFGSENVAAVFATACELGLAPENVLRGLARASLPGRRFERCRCGGFLLIDDSYNANPLSSARMITAARIMALESGLPLLFIMGEMLELGDRAKDAHRELGRIMAEAEPALIVWQGGQAGQVRRGLREGDYTGEFLPVAGEEDFVLFLKKMPLQQGLVLFKGSRTNHLERLVDIFREQMAEQGETHVI